MTGFSYDKFLRTQTEVGVLGRKIFRQASMEGCKGQKEEKVDL